MSLKLLPLSGMEDLHEKTKAELGCKGLSAQVLGTNCCMLSASVLLNSGCLGVILLSAACDLSASAQLWCFLPLRGRR